MRTIIIAVLAIPVWLLTGALQATEMGEKSLQIAYSTKFRSVDYLFTDRAEKQAVADGANYDFAIREVGWDLISAVGRACSSVKNIQAIFIDRINFKERHSFVVRGVMADLKFLKLDGALANETLKELVQALEREHVSVVQLAETNGVELLISNKN